VDAEDDDSALQRLLAVPTVQRIWALFTALERGWELEEIHRLTKIDRWFLTQFKQLVELKEQAVLVGLRGIPPDLMRSLKRAGFGDWQIGSMLGTDEEAVRAARLEQGLRVAYKRIDTCAAEFESFTPYLYGTYEKECEAEPTPRLKVALPLQEAGVRILGTSPDSIDLAEDRERFSRLLWELGIPQTPSGTATSLEEAREVALKIGFPLVVRPSYVLGGRAMAIVYDVAALDRYMITAVRTSPEHPILIDKFLEDAVELDVDAVADATGAVVIGGI